MQFFKGDLASLVMPANSYMKHEQLHAEKSVLLVSNTVPYFSTKIDSTQS